MSGNFICERSFDCARGLGNDGQCPGLHWYRHRRSTAGLSIRLLRLCSIFLCAWGLLWAGLFLQRNFSRCRPVVSVGLSPWLGQSSLHRVTRGEILRRWTRPSLCRPTWLSWPIRLSRARSSTRSISRRRLFRGSAASFGTAWRWPLKRPPQQSRGRT
jgi:hypothetical protein